MVGTMTVDTLAEHIVAGKINLHMIFSDPQLQMLYQTNRAVCDGALEQYAQRNGYKVMYTMRDREFDIPMFFLSGDTLDGEFMARKAAKLLQNKSGKSKAPWKLFNGTGGRSFDQYQGEQIVLLDERASMTDANWMALFAPDAAECPCRMFIYLADETLATPADCCSALQSIDIEHTMTPYFQTNLLTLIPLVLYDTNAAIREYMALRISEHLFGKHTPMQAHTYKIDGYSIHRQQTSDVQAFRAEDLNAAYHAGELELLTRFMVYRTIVDNQDADSFSPNAIDNAMDNITDMADLDEAFYHCAQRMSVLADRIMTF